MDDYITWLLSSKPTPKPRIPKITITDVDPQPRITATLIHKSKIPHQLRNIEDRYYIRGLPNTFDIKSPIIKSVIENVYKQRLKKGSFRAVIIATVRGVKNEEVKYFLFGVQLLGVVQLLIMQMILALQLIN